MERKLPSFQDYVKNSEVTCSIFIMFASIIQGLKFVTQQTIDWLKTEPKIAISTGMIGRYWDDIGSHQVQQIARAYNQELKWIMERKLPSFQDYVKNSEVTSSIFIMFASIIPGLKSVTQQTIDWLKTEPKIAISTGMIGRYGDDIASHQRESKGGKMLTVMDCYMKQYGVTKQETLSKFAELVEEAWMDLNKEFVATTSSSSSMAKEAVFTFLNHARMCDATYSTNNGDAYTDPKIFKAIIHALFILPIVMT